MGTLVSEEDVVDVIVMLVKESIVLVIVDVSVCTLGWNKLMMSRLECEVRAAFYSFLRPLSTLSKQDFLHADVDSFHCFLAFSGTRCTLTDEVHSKEHGPKLRIIKKLRIEMENRQFP